MGDKTGIEWTDATWNPVRGCSLVSPGCTNCYAMKQARRMSGAGDSYEGLTKMTSHGPVWTGEVRTVLSMLDQPLRWKRPRRIFVNSMSDLFHDDVPDAFIAKVFEVMANAPQHTYQILTKRAKRMRDWCSSIDAGNWPMWLFPWPLPHVWLGVSVEDQQRADERIPLLLETQATVRWISAEPLLGHVSLVVPFAGKHVDASRGAKPGIPRLDWVVVGGESGPRARPMHPEWARSLRDQCIGAGVPFLFKQHGEWVAGCDLPAPSYGFPIGSTELTVYKWHDHVVSYKLGKRVAGRQLDGRTWDEYPS